MKAVFWIFQGLFALVFLCIGIYLIQYNPDIKINIPLIVLYVLIQTAVWIGWNVTENKDDVGKLFLWMVVFDTVLGLIITTIYCAIWGFKDSWQGILVSAMLIWLSTIVFGNAPTTFLFGLFGGGLPKIPTSKLVKAGPGGMQN